MTTIQDYTRINWVNNTVPAINAINLNSMDKGIEENRTAIQELQELILELFIPGMIIQWNGGTVPLGWLLCDGTNGTPNLTNKFVRAGTSSGATGGDDNAVIVAHNHVFTGDALPAHAHSYIKPVTHSVDVGTSSIGATAVGATTGGTSAGTPSGTISSSGVSGTGKNIPAYYQLMYIMKG